MTRRAAPAILGGLIGIGLVLRLVKFGDSLYADELSTLYIVRGRSLGEVLDLVGSDAEVSPPLSFLASWAFTNIGSAPELIRLPSLIAGIATIPLTYLVGVRAVGRPTGLIAAAIVALSPFMVYFSTEGRGYALAIAFLLASTYALLRAVDSPRRAWWIAYALFSALAMYSHYTALFPLIAQLAWVLWTFPSARVAALVAGVGSMVLYAPWIPGVLDDRASPTIKLVEAFVASGFDGRLDALGAWGFGGPFDPPSEFPGTWVVAVGAFGVALAVTGALFEWLRGKWSLEQATRRGFVLLILLALSSPVLEFLQGALGGTEIFGSRNLGTASAGMALAIGALVSAAGTLWGGVALVAVLIAFISASAKNLDVSRAKPHFDEAASWIDERAQPGDLVVYVHDVRFTPVPLTPLNVYIEGDYETYRPLLPAGPPPFLPFTSDPPPAGQLISDVFASARGRRVFVVGAGDRMITEGSSLDAIEIGPAGAESSEVFNLPGSARTVDRIELPGLQELDGFKLEVSR